MLVFLDDILIYSKILEEHVTYLEQVLDVLRRNKLYLKASKCSFAQDSLEYLGHIISSKGVATDQAKIEAMLHWPLPTIVTELLRVFLGLTGYYRRSVKNYGLMAKPLTRLLRLKQFTWSKTAQAAFDDIKLAMTKTQYWLCQTFNYPSPWR